MSQALQLYVDSHYVSPYALSAFVALNEKNLDFELQTVNLERRDNCAPAYAGMSLTQRVPTLVHGTFALSESSAISEYLEDSFAGPPLYPVAPQQRARARQVQAWLRSDLLPIRQERSTLVVFQGQQCPPLSEAAEMAAVKLIEVAQWLLRDGADGLFGEWSLADVDLALMLNRLIFNGDPVPARLQAYAQRHWQRPAVQRWLKLPRPALAE